jgi:hypothetical protein
MNRLPIPATAKSSAVCSGVSMVSLSTNDTREFLGFRQVEDMITIRWLEKRRPYWARLEQLVQQSNSGIAALSHNELKELGLLYRQIASDLAAVREDAGSRRLAVYLNQLLGRTHNLIYMGHKPKISALVLFYRYTYPRVFRETLPQTLLAVTVVMVADNSRMGPDAA